MANVYIYETINLPIRLSREGALVDAKKVIISIKQNNIQVDKDESELGLDIENNIINLYLSQEETSLFTPERTAELQLNIYYENTERDVSGKATIKIKDNLYKKVIHDE